MGTIAGAMIGAGVGLATGGIFGAISLAVIKPRSENI